MSIKVILNKVESCILKDFEKILTLNEYEKQKLTKSNSYSEQIQKLKHIYKKMNAKSQNIQSEIDEDDSSDALDKKEFVDEEENNIHINNNNNNMEIENPINIGNNIENNIANNIENTNINNLEKNINSSIRINIEKEKKSEKDIKDVDKNIDKQDNIGTKVQNNNNLLFKILLIIHNIGSTIGRSKVFQENLSELNKQLKCINLVVTCENLTIPYYWTSEVKDKYQFCFIKFNTFLPYENEIDENTIKGEHDINDGVGLKEIFISFSDLQKRLIMEIAKLQLKNKYDNLTPKGLIDYFIKTGKGTVINMLKLETVLNDPIEHGIVTLKTCNSNNKEIYRVNLEKTLCEKIANGEYLG